MAQRIELQAILESFVPNVYFQPPSNVQIVYPCIVYEREPSSVSFAGNKKYRGTTRYQITVIDRDPESPILPLVNGLPLSAHNRCFSKDNLHHDVFTVFF